MFLTITLPTYNVGVSVGVAVGCFVSKQFRVTENAAEPKLALAVVIGTANGSTKFVKINLPLTLSITHFCNAFSKNNLFESEVLKPILLLLLNFIVDVHAFLPDSLI